MCRLPLLTKLKLIQNVQGLRDVFTNSEYEELSGARKELIKEISGHISSIKAKVREMIDARKACNVLKEGVEMATAYDEKVRPYLSSIRYHIDKLELVVDNEMWPLPKYRELLFNN